MNKTLNKKIKIIGNILTILALCFVLKKLIESDLDISKYFVSGRGFTFICLTIFNVLVVLVSFIPWKIILSILSGIKIPVEVIISVYIKSNIMKYIPGNIFQYAGRNELATRAEVSYVDVAVATIIDIGLVVFVTLLMPIILLGDKAMEQLIQTGYEATLLLIGVFIIGILCVAIYFSRLRDRALLLLNKYKALLTLQNLSKLILCCIFYTVYLLFFSGIYIAILIYYFNIEVDFQTWLNLIGAFILSWLIGFITPGAPGGLGIREVAMTFAAKSMVSSEIIVASMIIFRFLNVVADLGAYLVSNLVLKFFSWSNRNSL